MALQVLEVTIELIAKLRKPLEQLRASVPWGGMRGENTSDLYRQIRRAASSVALNLGEARKRISRDRVQRFRIAAGSAEEVRTGLRVAQAWGDLSGDEIGEAFVLLDRVLAMLWRLTSG